jgi:hypothetical protein
MSVCSHCGGELVTEHELEILCCLVCRRFALLRGSWPNKSTEERNMIIQLSDEQISRVLTLCGKIAAIRNEIPAAPRGFEVSTEIARALRSSLEAQNADLLELGALLR